MPKTNPEENPLLAIAEAALYIPELARGLEGEVVIAASACVVMNEEDVASHKRTLAEIHRAQRTLVEAGWRRHPSKERTWNEQSSHNVEIACYFKRFDQTEPPPRSDLLFRDNNKRALPNWIVVRVTTRFGLHAEFVGVGPKQDPWN